MGVGGVDDEHPVVIEVAQQLRLGFDDAFDAVEELGMGEGDPGVEHQVRTQQAAEQIELSGTAHAGLGDKDRGLFRLRQQLCGQTEGGVPVALGEAGREALREQGGEHVLGRGLAHRTGHCQYTPIAAGTVVRGEPVIGRERVVDEHEGFASGHRRKLGIAPYQRGRGHLESPVDKCVAVGSRTGERDEEVAFANQARVDLRTRDRDRGMTSEVTIEQARHGVNPHAHPALHRDSCSISWAANRSHRLRRNRPLEAYDGLSDPREERRRHR